MRLLLILSILSIWLLASNLNTCKGCHPIIVNEFENSMHKKSTIRDDKIHKAIWDRHPFKKKGNYTCAKCHTPNNSHSGITCLSCHTIKNIKRHPKSNENVYEKRDKYFYSAEKGMENKKVVYKEKSSWLGLFTKTVGSPYHDIDYTNKIFYTGEVCMGCHSHKKNSHRLNVCKTGNKGVRENGDNCISCHMPKVKGSATNIRISKKHAFHGFAGVINKPELLSKYIDINYKRGESGFDIIIHNKAPHNLMLHPLRIVQLRVKLKSKGKDKEKNLKVHNFVRILGRKSKPTMPWLATKVLKDTMINPDEKRVVHFDTNLQKGDEIEAILGFYIVNPKVIKKLGLQDDKKLSEFIPLKKSYFKVK
jgi:hypothetical protein